ncbi:MAG: protein kinase [Lentisphaerae bacterium]|jgi:DNA-binding response OmpR family regulator|nr:protein kinase [Lentisphaerota bacterium]MBT4816587.1 protein kinase [Lentisphaerota bacterium]MBT5609478.1 protein kinase [Lentisphaerota bacterium]MBT7057711.1 protein kinase [Lentisphaerota bacterium]MBT7848660.1 protein kinase [Lentisphaerota bacterium]
MKQILCVDDDVQVLQVFRKILARAGYEVRTCTNGADAINAFATSPPDLVLLDLTMPGLSGLETCARLRENPAALGVPMIMVSGVQEQDAIMACLSEGADDYILKPVTPPELLAKLAFALKKSEQQGGEESSLEPGTRFAERFELGQQIGSGSFGRVFKARDLSSGDDVALKVFELPHAQRSDKAFITALLREAYEMSRLDCSSIVRFHDFGQTGIFYYLAMEYLDGNSLTAFVEENGVLEEVSIAVIGYEIASAIQYLAERNMVHGDIKPENIMLTADGDVKLLDFGLARTCSEVNMAVTDEIMTTPAFSAPEAFYADSNLDVNSDIYALGGTLYYAAAAVPPFPGDTMEEVLAIRFEQAPTPIRELNPNISADLAQLIEAMLHQEQGSRPAISSVLATLQNVISRH